MIELIIPGKPMGKQRPKVFQKHGVTPDKTVNYETLVKELYIMNKLPKIEGYLKVNITAYYDVPQSASKKNKAAMLIGAIRPDKKPDVDNIAKIICDSLNQIAYDDDKQIVSLTIEKFYSEEPKVLVKIENC